MSGWAAAGAAAGSIIGGIATTAINANQTKKQNEAQRNHELHMWNLNNAYNTPMEQRKRMEAAGFNPHMMYGQGTVANTSSMSNPSRPNPLPQYDINAAVNSGLDAYNSVKRGFTQQDLADEQIKTMQTQQGKTIQDTANAQIQGARSQVELDKARANFNTSLEFSRQQLRQMELDNVEREFRNANLEPELELKTREALARIKNLAATASATEVKKAIDQEELKLRKSGLSGSDNVFARIVAKTIDLEAIKKDGKKFFDWTHPEFWKEKFKKFKQ